jgi:serine/threonine protein kinase
MSHFPHALFLRLCSDLKPENIMLDKEGHIRLCDFGFASALDPAQASGAAPLQDGCGTVMYMAPELVDKSSKSHGYPVDWWALGCVLVEMLTGE